MHPRPLLGVNIDHVATLRQVRGTAYPDPIEAARCAEQAGADSITLHLREDRRHIQDQDVWRLRDAINIPINLELANSEEMIAFACRLAPQYCCLVPERRAELTTEGGLDLHSRGKQIQASCIRLGAAGIRVALFIEAAPGHIEQAAALGAGCVELHTGPFANAGPETRKQEQARLQAGVGRGLQLGLRVHAGHGLHYDNVAQISSIEGISELNIGHSIVARAVFTGMEAAVREMKQLILAPQPAP